MRLMYIPCPGISLSDGSIPLCSRLFSSLFQRMDNKWILIEKHGLEF